MTDSPLASSFVQARLYKVNPGRPLRLVVVHDMEAPQGPLTAENCARYFAGPSAGGSAHYCVDQNSVVQCVREADQAAHAPGANTDGIGVELAGYARNSTEEWLIEPSGSTLKLGARLVADICARTGIAPRWLSDGELADGRTKGLATHAQVSRVFKRSDHTDPGPNFPADEFLAMVLGQTSTPAAPPVTLPPILGGIAVQFFFLRDPDNGTIALAGGWADRPAFLIHACAGPDEYTWLKGIYSMATDLGDNQLIKVLPFIGKA